MSKQQISRYKVIGTVELQHDKGMSQEQLEYCIERMFLMLPTIVRGKSENPVFGREVKKRIIILKSTGDGKFKKVEDKPKEKVEDKSKKPVKLADKHKKHGKGH